METVSHLHNKHAYIQFLNNKSKRKITVTEWENNVFTASGNKTQIKQTEEEVYHFILLSGKAPTVTC